MNWALVAPSTIQPWVPNFPLPQRHHPYLIPTYTETEVSKFWWNFHHCSSYSNRQYIPTYYVINFCDDRKEPWLKIDINILIALQKCIFTTQTPNTHSKSIMVFRTYTDNVSTPSHPTSTGTENAKMQFLFLEFRENWWRVHVQFYYFIEPYQYTSSRIALTSMFFHTNIRGPSQ